MSNPFTTTLANAPDIVSDTTLIDNGMAFTSLEEMARVYSTVGVNLRLDDLSESGSEEMLAEIINAATETVNSFTLRYYNLSAIYQSPWIRRRATIIACYYLSMRRANGTQFAHEYQRIMEELEKFLGPVAPMIPGVTGLPCPVRTSNIPTIASYIVDDRNRYRKLRRAEDYSTKPYPGAYQYVQPLAKDYT